MLASGGARSALGLGDLALHLGQQSDNFVGGLANQREALLGRRKLSRLFQFDHFLHHAVHVLVLFLKLLKPSQLAVSRASVAV